MFCASNELIFKMNNRTVNPPKARSVCERFNYLINERRSFLKRSIEASVIEEDYGEHETSIYSLMEEMDENKLDRKKIRVLRKLGKSYYKNISRPSAIWPSISLMIILYKTEFNTTKMRKGQLKSVCCRRSEAQIRLIQTTGFLRKN